MRIAGVPVAVPSTVVTNPANFASRAAASGCATGCSPCSRRGGRVANRPQRPRSARRAAVGDWRVVLLSAIADEEVLVRAVRAGAAGYLTKDLDLECLARVLRSVAFGEAALPRKLTMRLIERLRTEPEFAAGLRPVRSTLTQREWEVLDLLIANASTRDIAGALVLTPATVHSHIKNIYRKLRVRSRGEAINAAQQMLNEVAFGQPAPTVRT